MQFFTSKNTSINEKKLPRLYSVAQVPAGVSVLDYGCGKFTAHLKTAASDHGWKWAGYDPYNQPGSVPVPAEYVFCSNVLNVIAEDEVINAIIRECVDLAAVAAVFTIYPGDGSGNGRQTGPDQYQRNEKITAYRDRIKSLGYTVRSSGGALYVTA